MAEDEATEKQLAKLKGLSGKDYSEFNLTKREASRKIEELLDTKKPQATKQSGDKSDSIEQQVAIKAITELWNTDHLTKDDTEVKACRAWFKDKLSSYYGAREIQAVVKAEVLKEEPSQPPLAQVPKLTINMDWLSESIKKIWETSKAFVQFLVDKYEISMGGSVRDMVDKLTQEQQAGLCKEIQERLNKRKGFIG